MNNLPLSCLLLPCVLLSTTSCSSKKDGPETAQEINKQRIESHASRTAQTVSADSETKQENVAKFMVDLANAERTKFELSKLASQRAITPGVKAYAQQIVQHYTAEGERSLNAQAQQYRITLSPTLSTDSQTMISMLQKEDEGAGFDKRYLNFMAELNDNSTSKAKNLVKNANKPALMSFIENLMAVNRQDMDKATELKSTV